MNFEVLLAKWEESVRLGLIEQIQTEYRSLGFSQTLHKIPRNLCCSLASILRRSEMMIEALRLLRPFVVEKHHRTPATDQEVIEYCNNLKKLGLANEAFNRLIRIDPQRSPEVLVNQAYYHIRRWDYASAIPLLSRYLELDGIDEYKKSVALANLASAYLENNEPEKAITAIVKLEKQSKEKKWTKLYINCLEMRAEYLTGTKDFSQADDVLKKVRQLSISESLRDLFFLEKRKAIIHALKNGDIECLSEIRSQALQRRQWESVRDIDFHTALITKDQKLIDYLYFGTPHFGFHRKVERHFATISPVYFINGQHQQHLNLSTGDPLLKPGQITHKLLHALASDFYCPPDRGVLFNLIFQGEDFDYETSINRVHQAILRTRNWLKKQNIPVEINQNEEVYQYAFSGNFCFIKERETLPLRTEMVFLESLSKQFGEQFFDIHQAGEALQINRYKTNRVLKSLIDENAILKTGTGKNVKYLICKKQKGE